MNRVKKLFARLEFTPFLASLALITLVALGLRLWGIQFGLPYEYHVDEVQYVRQAASMGQSGLQPVWWNNPPLFKYILLAEYGGLFAIGRLLGHYASVADFGAKNSLDPTNLYLLGRATSALFGAATVPLVYFIGKQSWSRTAGIVGAGFLAVAFIHVRDSHYAVNDIAFTFFATLAVLASVMIVQSGEYKWYVLAGLALGLGFATKYTGAFLLIPVAVAHFLSPDVDLRSAKTVHARRFFLVLLIAFLSAVVASPYFIITPKNVFTDAYEALYLAGQYGFDGWQIDPSGGYVFYLRTLVWGLGLGLSILGLLGILSAVVRKRRVDLVLLSFPIFYYLVAGQQESYYFARFIIPVVPVILVMAAIALVSISERAFPSESRQLPILVLVSILVSLAPLASSLRFNELLANKEDTRTLAKSWIEQELPEGSVIAVDWSFYGPPIATESTPVPFASKQFEVLVVGGHGLADKPLTWYFDHGIEYMVTSSFISELDVLSETEQRSREAFYHALEEQETLLAEFHPGRSDVPLPFIFDELYGPAVSLTERTMTGPILRLYALGLDNGSAGTSK